MRDLADTAAALKLAAQEAEFAARARDPRELGEAGNRITELWPRWDEAFRGYLAGRGGNGMSL